MSKALPLSQVLTALIAHIDTLGKPVHIGWDEVSLWQDDALPILLRVELLTKSNPSQSLECKGCENRCYMPVELTEDKQRAFIVCEDIDKQGEMGRIAISLPRLRQWRTSSKHFATVIAGLLGFEGVANYKKDTDIYELGMLKSDTGRRWVSLTANPLTLVINQHATPVNDLLYIDHNELVIDREQINELLNNPTSNAKVYTPNKDRQEDRKLETLAMYQDWNDAYLYSRKKNPSESNVWHSRQIADLPIAKNRDSETIRKNMK